MKGKFSRSVSLVIGLLIPSICYGITANSSRNIHLFSLAFTIINLVLLVTSLISLKQFLFPDEHNKTGFQTFNLIFAIVFYALSLSFLVSYKEYYIGFETLSTGECIKKIFFEIDISTAKHWIIIGAVFVNIFYIIRNGRASGYPG